MIITYTHSAHIHGRFKQWLKPFYHWFESIGYSVFIVAQCRSDAIVTWGCKPMRHLAWCYSSFVKKRSARLLFRLPTNPFVPLVDKPGICLDVAAEWEQTKWSKHARNAVDKVWLFGSCGTDFQRLMMFSFTLNSKILTVFFVVKVWCLEWTLFVAVE